MCTVHAKVQNINIYFGVKWVKEENVYTSVLLICVAAHVLYNFSVITSYVSLKFAHHLLAEVLSENVHNRLDIYMKLILLLRYDED